MRAEPAVHDPGERAQAGAKGAHPRDGVDVLRGSLICALVLTAGTGEGALYTAARGMLPFVAGLGFGVAVREAERRSRGISRLWVLHLLATWLITFWPGMWGTPEVLRTCAASACLLILARRCGPGGRAILLGAALGIVAAAWTRDPPYWLQLGVSELQYGLGGAWPRGWEGALSGAALFLAGFGAAGWPAVPPAARWRGITRPMRALGRMPLTALVGQAAVAALAHAMSDSGPPWLPVVVTDTALVAQIVFATWWLGSRERGPCEQALILARAGAWRLARKGNIRRAESV